MAHVVFTEDPDTGLPVTLLNSLFDKTTTSYKFFFFLGLLDWFDSSVHPEWRGFNDLSVPLTWIGDRMAIHAWDPVVYFGLSLGANDRLSQPLIKIRDDITLAGERFSLRAETAIPRYRNHGSFDETLLDIATRYVPYRLIRNFYQKETKGLRDHGVNAAIARACEEDPREKSMYRLENGASHLNVRPNWAVFIVRNIGLLRKWTRGHLVDYLTARNPLAPSVASKLQRVPAVNLSVQRKFVWWLIDSKKIPDTCVYSGEQLTWDTMALDHFLPRVLVAHDQIWNLLPAHRTVNGSKSAIIPHDDYLTAVAETQFNYSKFFRDLSNPVSEQNRDRLEFETKNALQLASAETTQADFISAYHRVVKPWMEIAPSFGLQTVWR